jgi:hypothetical protein
MGWVSAGPCLHGPEAQCGATRYQMLECTWQAEEDIPDPQILVEQFEAEAKEEGLNLETKEPVLLREAVIFGWAKSLEAHA